MTPRFDRTRRFAQPYAMLLVDAIFVVIWISAFATQAAYNSADDCGKVCKLSKAIVGLGVFIAYVSSPRSACHGLMTDLLPSILFALTTLISGYTLQFWKFHGNLPGYDNRQIRGGESAIDPDKAAFSMAPHDDEAYERVNMDDNEAYAGERYGHVNPYSSEDYDDPNRYGALPPRTNNEGMFDAETEYTSSGGAGPGPVPPPGGPGPSSFAPGPYDAAAQFPAGNYDRIQR